MKVSLRKVGPKFKEEGLQMYFYGLDKEAFDKWDDGVLFLNANPSGKKSPLATMAGGNAYVVDYYDEADLDADYVNEPSAGEMASANEYGGVGAVFEQFDTHLLASTLSREGIYFLVKED